MHVSQLVVIAMLAGSACSTDSVPEPARASQPMFKGVELYSWPDPANKQWRFALLPGTNRMKTSAEVLGSPAAVGSIEELKQRISLLAPGESVFWHVPADARFAVPSSGVIRDIVNHAATSGVTVTVTGEQ